MAKNIKVRNKPSGNLGVSIAGTSLGGSNHKMSRSEGVFISDEAYRNDIIGKPYPGVINYITQRYLAYTSTVVRAIISLRTSQIAMLPRTIVPKNEDEPTRKINIFDYNQYELTYHPAFDEPEKAFLKKMYLRVDPNAYKIDKQMLFEEARDDFTPTELSTIDYLQEKHDKFYAKRDKDIDAINELLDNPDPWYTDTKSWSQLIKAILFDLVALDRGAILKLRDEYGELRGLMPTDGACYADDTEILTRRGWLFFPELEEGDEVATRNPRGEFEWQPFTDFYEYDWDGEMVHIQSRTMDLLVTPNHRMLLSTTPSTVRKGNYYKERFVEAGDLLEKVPYGYGIPRTSTWVGTPIPSQTFDDYKRVTSITSPITMDGKDFAAFMGMYLSEGSTSKGKHVYISQMSYSKGYTEFKELLEKLFPTVRYNGTSFVVNSSPLVRYLKQFGYSYEKYIPELILNATPEEQAIFWHYYLLGDGHRDGGRDRIKTASRRMADGLQELSQKMGLSASIGVKLPPSQDVWYINGEPRNTEKWRPTYVVSQQRTTSTSFTPSSTHYEGKVYCVSVPNETVYVRRGGQAAWCGNSLRPLINEYGYYDDDKAYVQVIERGGTPQAYLSKDDVIILKMHPLTDMRYFGYGLSPMETLFTAALTDIYIDKGQLDFYRKGGSIPEGFISIEPPTSREGVISHMDQETIEYMQRNLQSLMAGDYTQMPIFSGGKVSYIDFKGKKRDMQYKELADYSARKTCAVMQVSPQDVGLTADVNRATGTVQQELTRSKGLLPLMSTISESITREVIDEMREEKDLKLAFKENDDEKEKNDWTVAQQQLITGVLTINEYRVAHGKAPVPWGNAPMQGLRNWRDESEEEESMGGGGGLPPMPGGGGGGPFGGPAAGPFAGAPGGPPQAPGGPVPPGIANPGGPVGGASPLAGRPPDALKSSRFFALNYNPATEEEAEELMIKGFSDMLQEEFLEHVRLNDIHNYPGGEWVRTPAESYVHFAKTNPSLGIEINLPEDVDKRDVLLLSAYSDGKVNLDSARLPIVKNMAAAALNNMDADIRSKISEISRGNEEEAVERYIYSKLDAPLRDALHKDFYRFKSFAVTDAQLEEVAEILDV